LPEPFQRVVLALIGSAPPGATRSVDRQQPEEGRAFDDDVVHSELVPRLVRQRLLHSTSRPPSSTTRLGPLARSMSRHTVEVLLTVADLGGFRRGDRPWRNGLSPISTSCPPRATGVVARPRARCSRWALGAMSITSVCSPCRASPASRLTVLVVCRRRPSGLADGEPPATVGRGELQRLRVHHLGPPRAPSASIGVHPAPSRTARGLVAGSIGR